MSNYFSTFDELRVMMYHYNRDKNSLNCHVHQTKRDRILNGHIYRQNCGKNLDLAMQEKFLTPRTVVILMVWNQFRLYHLRSHWKYPNLAILASHVSERHVLVGRKSTHALNFAVVEKTVKNILNLMLKVTTFIFTTFILLVMKTFTISVL